MNIKSISIIFSIYMVLIPTAHSAVLTFDFVNLPSKYSPFPQDYGDRISSVTDGNFVYGAAGGLTPNIEVSYGPNPSDIYPAHSTIGGTFGDLSNLIYGAQYGAGYVDVILTADAGWNVVLSSFDLAAWASPSYTINSVEVFDQLDNALYSETNVTILGGATHSNFSFDSPIMGSELTIRFDSNNLGPSFTDNIGIDNIEFSQIQAGEYSVVPIPAALPLFLTGLAALPIVTRRNSKH